VTPGALAAGTDVNAKGKNGWTPLHRAAIYGRKEIVELLIAKGAEVNAQGQYMGTPLHNAANKGHKKIVELLIAKGADVNAKDNRLRKTPLDVVIMRKHAEIADLLRKHGGKTGEELKAERK
jgi:cytohesin